MSGKHGAENKMEKASGAALIRRLRASVRAVVCRTMFAVDAGEPVQSALSRTLHDVPLEPAQRRQATDLVYTLLRTEIRCEFVLRTLLKQYDKLPDLFQLLMKAAAAAMLFEKHAPVHAIVNETVNDVRTVYGRGLDRVANGVLRSLQRLGRGPLEQDFYRKAGDGPMDPVFRFYSMPRSIGRLLVRQYGEEEATALCARAMSRPCTGIRVNAAHGGWEKLQLQFLTSGAALLPGAGADVAGCLFVPGAVSSVGEDRLLSLQEEGALSFQAAGSQCVLAELGLHREKRPVWDACAGFGGKTTALLESGCNVVLSTDVSWQRLHRLPGEIARLGLPAPAVALADASHPAVAAFDGCLVLDVPCSGLGVLARRPDLRRRKPDFAAYTALQEKILRAACQCAAPSSTIAYITCTVNKDENGTLVRTVCADTGCLEIEAEWSTPTASPLEGMYGALLRVKK